MRRLIACFALLLAIAGAPALGSQATLVVPAAPLSMTGLASFLDSALLSIGSCNAGNTAPSNGPGAAPFAQECWTDTTSSTNWKFQFYDGTSWVEFGALNSSTHVWTPFFGAPGSSAQMWIGQSAAQPAWVSMSGDCTLNSSGVIACTKINGITWPSSGNSGGIPYFSATGTIGSTATLTAHGFLVGEGSSASPVAMAACTNGQLPIGQTSADPICKTVGTDATLDQNGNLTIANSAVTNAKRANMGANTVSGNATGGSAAPTDVAPATARSSSLLNVDQFTGHGDSIYTILATDRTVGTNASFTASRTWTLPAASAVNPGQEIVVADFQGTVTGGNTLVIARAGSDTINHSATSVTISAASGAYLLRSDGVSNWSAQSLGAASGGGVSSVTCGTGLSGGTITTSGTCALDLTHANTWTGAQTFNGHILSTSPTPTVSGTSCSLTRGSDAAGTLAQGTTGNGSCTVTFGTAYGAAPSCVVTSGTTAVSGLGISTSTTALTINYVGNNGSPFFYQCTGTT